MTIPRIPLLVVMVLLSIGLAACELSAATPPPTTPLSDGPMATLQSELAMIATQTAVAAGDEASPTPPPASQEGEPEPVDSSPGDDEQPAEPVNEPTLVVVIDTPHPVSSPTPGSPTTHILQQGEFPFCIARRYNVDPNELLSLNGLSADARPEIGFEMKIPTTGNPFLGDRALRAHPTTYTVAAGDTIHSIACLFGDVDPYAIAEANGLSEPYSLSAGQTIHIP
jgi:LysM repeat protein